MKKLYTHINLNYLHTIADGDEAFAAEMLNNFKASIPKYITALTNAINTCHKEEVKFFVHKLKSSVQIAGTNQILAVLTDIEQSVEKNGFTDYLTEKTYLLQSLYEQALIELDFELNTLPN